MNNIIMNKLIIMTILIPSISAFLLDPMFIETKQQLITMFDCDFYNNMNDMEFPVNDMHVSINVNKMNYAIYITITSKDDDMNQKYKVGITNICPDSYNKFICSDNMCISDMVYSIKIDSTLPNLDKMLTHILTFDKTYYQYFI